MTLEEALNRFDGVGYRLAIALSVSPQAVNLWKKNNKIPFGQQVKLEHYTKGELKADNYLEEQGKEMEKKLDKMIKRRKSEEQKLKDLIKKGNKK